MRRCFIVKVNDVEVARYSGNYGSGYQIATNHAADIYNDIQDMIRDGHDMSEYIVTVNDKRIEEILY